MVTRSPVPISRGKCGSKNPISSARHVTVFPPFPGPGGPCGPGGPGGPGWLLAHAIASSTTAQIWARSSSFAMLFRIWSDVSVGDREGGVVDVCRVI